MISLDKLLGGISHSVQNAQDAMQKTELQNFLRYFEEESVENADAVSVISPKLQPFCLNEGNPLLNVPLVTLTGHHSLALDNVRIVLNVVAKCDDNGIQVDVCAGEETNDHQPRHQITLEFRQKEVSEGVSRILDAANQFI